jgi:hypothetical protein
VQYAVEGSPVGCYKTGNGSGIISIAKIRYQETSSKETAEKQSLWGATTKKKLVEID